MSDTPDIVLCTEDRLEQLTTADEHSVNVGKEDALVSAAFGRLGLRTARVSWSHVGQDWAAPRAAVLRTTWDYFHRFPEFAEWVKHVGSVGRLINPAELVLWNADKHYLFDVENRGFAIPPTRFIEVREHTTLEKLFQETGWTDVVLKPSVSGGARHTYRLGPAEAAAHEQIFHGLLQSESWMLQEFQPRIVTEGELSLILFGGKFSHALIKRPQTEDFRVQLHHGGTYALATPSQAQIDLAEQIVASCDPAPVYARVDFVSDGTNDLLMELEIIEPELFFRFVPEAADRFATAVAAAL